jgi:hypothetical protein
MSRRRGTGPDPAAAVPAVYEGPEVVTALLQRAGSPHDVEEVVEAFRRAQAAGEARADTIPTLFPDEPRFASPDEAQRLYGNLFGLWARVAAGRGESDDAPAAVPPPVTVAEPVEPLPERGSEPGDLLSPDVVEAVWKSLANLSPRELQRRRDRFTNGQPDLVAWLETTPLPEAGGLAAMDLAFEAWAMFDQAFGDRLGAVAFRDLRALEREPPPLADAQPALAAYAAEQLDAVADDDPAFDPAARAQVERAVATVGAALTAAVVEPS